MSFEIRVRLKAREDLTDAALWYEAQNAGLGSDFVDEVERTFDKIADNPNSLSNTASRNSSRYPATLSVRSLLPHI